MLADGTKWHNVVTAECSLTNVRHTRRNNKFLGLGERKLEMAIIKIFTEAGTNIRKSADTVPAAFLNESGINKTLEQLKKRRFNEFIPDI